MPVCIFCRRSRTTNAHVFRKAWITKMFPAAEKFRHSRDGLSVPREDRGWWTTSAADIKVNAACASCNSGWMDRLDHLAEDVFLTSAVLGYGVKLPLMSEKTTVAQWLGLIACLSDQTSATPTIPPRVHKDVYEGRVPEGLQAWLFCTEPPRDTDDVAVTLWGANRHLTLKGNLVDRLDVFFVTFCIHKLVAHVSVVTDDDPAKANIRRSVDGFARQIWPPPLTPFFWPPPQTLPWEAALELPDELHRTVQERKRKQGEK